MYLLEALYAACRLLQLSFEQASLMSSERSDKTEAHQQKKKSCLCFCGGKGFEVLGEEHDISRSDEIPA